MAQFATENIRTIALVGHGASGKTTLAEALLHKSGAITATGSVERGTQAFNLCGLAGTIHARERDKQRRHRSASH